MNNGTIYLDDQGGSVMNVLKEDVSPTLMLNAAKAHALIVCQKVSRPKVVAFAQNARDEVRMIGTDGQVAGALAANNGMHQTTYIVVNKRKVKG